MNMSSFVGGFTLSQCPNLRNWWSHPTVKLEAGLLALGGGGVPVRGTVLNLAPLFLWPKKKSSIPKPFLTCANWIQDPFCECSFQCQLLNMPCKSICILNVVCASLKQHCTYKCCLQYVYSACILGGKKHTHNSNTPTKPTGENVDKNINAYVT